MNVWNALPLFRLLLPFVVGVLVATFTEVRLEWWMLLLLFFGLFLSFQFTFKFRYRQLFGAYVSIFIFSFSLLWTANYPFKTQVQYFGNFLEKDATLLVEILEQPEEKTKTWKPISRSR